MTVKQICVLKVVSFYTVLTYTTEVQNYRTGISWFDASEKCGEMGLENEMLTLQRLDSLQNNEFWIGVIEYEELTPWIEEIGCFEKKTVSQIPSIQTTIGYCQHMCQQQSDKSAYFGYTENKECRCFLTEDIQPAGNVSVKNCKENCTKYTMIYRRFDDMKISDDTKMKCSISNCKSGKISIFPQDCTKTNSSIRTMCQNGKIPEGQSWGIKKGKATEKCYEKGLLLASPTEIDCSTDQLTWTNVFRQDITAKYRIAKPYSRQFEFCHVGKRTDSNTSLTVTKKKCCKKLKWFVCRKNDTTKKVVWFGNNESDNKIDDGSTNLGIIIGGSIGGTITVIVVVLVIIFLSRKTNIRVQSRTKGQLTLSCKSKNDKNNGDQNNRHDQNKSEDSNINSAYNVVRNKPHLAATDDIYTISADNSYDHLNNVMNRKNKLAPNIYGMAGKCGEGEYDTLANMQQSNAMQLETIYDGNILSNATRAVDSTYDTADNLEHFNCSTEGLYDQNYITSNV